MQRARKLSAWLAVAGVAALLTGESWLSGKLFVPLTPDDFPAWAAGREPEELNHHPHPNWCMSDVLHLIVPGLATTKAALERLELPLWDASQALGVPHIDQVHYSVFYPPAWLALGLGLKGLGFVAWLHLFVAGGGMLLYLGELKRSGPARVAGALAFATSAWMTARLHSLPVTGAAVWLPWVMWGLERGAQRGTRAPYAVAAVALAFSFLAGFPQASLLILSLAVTVEVARTAWRLLRRQPAVGSAVTAAGAVVVGLLLAAPQLLPTLDYMKHESARAETDASVLAAELLEPPLLKHLVVPDYYATSGLVGPHPLAFADLKQGLFPVMVNRAETSMGVGVLSLILAAAAMLFGRTWLTRLYSLIVLVLFGLLLWPEGFVAVAEYVPPLQFGSPKRLLLITTFALSVLLGGGLDLLQRQRLRVTVTCWVLSIGLTALTFWLMISVPSAAEDLDIEAWSDKVAASLTERGAQGVTGAQIRTLIPRENFEVASDRSFQASLAALVMAVAAVILFRPRSMPTERGWTTRAERGPLLLTMLIGLELAFTALPMLRAAPAKGVTTESDQIGRLRVPRLAKAARDTDPDSGVPPRVARIGVGEGYLRPNFPGLFGLHDVQAYAPMLPQRTVELLQAVAPGAARSGSHLGGFTDPTRLALPAVDMLSIQAVLTDMEELEIPGFEESETVGHVRVLRNTEALPRAYFVEQAEVISADKMRLLKLASPDFVPLEQVVLDTNFGPWVEAEVAPREKPRRRAAAEDTDAGEEGAAADGERPRKKGKRKRDRAAPDGAAAPAADGGAGAGAGDDGAPTPAVDDTAPADDGGRPNRRAPRRNRRNDGDGAPAAQTPPPGDDAATPEDGGASAASTATPDGGGQLDTNAAPAKGNAAAKAAGKKGGKNAEGKKGGRKGGAQRTRDDRGGEERGAGGRRPERAKQRSSEEPADDGTRLSAASPMLAPLALAPFVVGLKLAAPPQDQEADDEATGGDEATPRPKTRQGKGPGRGRGQQGRANAAAADEDEAAGADDGQAAGAPEGRRGRRPKAADGETADDPSVPAQQLPPAADGARTDDDAAAEPATPADGAETDDAGAGDGDGDADGDAAAEDGDDGVPSDDDEEATGEGVEEEIPRPWSPGARGVRVESYEPGLVELLVAPGPSGLLVFSESWHPGWTATVGGRDAPVRRANHAIIAVPVDANESDVLVVLRFAPDVQRTGALLGGAGLLALLLGLLRPLERIARFIRRRREGSPAKPSRRRKTKRRAAAADDASESDGGARSAEARDDEDFDDEGFDAEGLDDARATDAPGDEDFEGEDFDDDALDDEAAFDEDRSDEDEPRESAP